MRRCRSQKPAKSTASIFPVVAGCHRARAICNASNVESFDERQKRKYKRLQENMSAKGDFSDDFPNIVKNVVLLEFRVSWETLWVIAETCKCTTKTYIATSRPAAVARAASLPPILLCRRDVAKRTPGSLKQRPDLGIFLASDGPRRKCKPASPPPARVCLSGKRQTIGEPAMQVEIIEIAQAVL